MRWRDTKSLMDEAQPLVTLGWREWVSLPEFGVARIKAKVDTGARTSALHASRVRPFVEAGVQRVEFCLHPDQHSTDTELLCTAAAVDQRTVTDSGGRGEERWVVSTLLSIGSASWPIEITLTSRNDMRFRMLLGREAYRGCFLVDAGKSYYGGKPKRKKKPKPN